MIQLAVVLAVIVGVIFLIRLFGAWMLRINEVIELLRMINKKMKP